MPVSLLRQCQSAGTAHGGSRAQRRHPGVAGIPIQIVKGRFTEVSLFRIIFQFGRRTSDNQQVWIISLGNKNQPVWAPADLEPELSILTPPSGNDFDISDSLGADQSRRMFEGIIAAAKIVENVIHDPVPSAGL